MDKDSLILVVTSDIENTFHHLEINPRHEYPTELGMVSNKETVADLTERGDDYASDWQEVSDRGLRYSTNSVPVEFTETRAPGIRSFLPLGHFRCMRNVEHHTPHCRTRS